MRSICRRSTLGGKPTRSRKKRVKLDCAAKPSVLAISSSGAGGVRHHRIGLFEHQPIDEHVGRDADRTAELLVEARARQAHIARHVGIIDVEVRPLAQLPQRMADAVIGHAGAAVDQMIGRGIGDQAADHRLEFIVGGFVLRPASAAPIRSARARIGALVCAASVPKPTAPSPRLSAIQIGSI